MVKSLILENPEEHTINDLARIVIKKTGSNSDIIHKPLPEDDSEEEMSQHYPSNECFRMETKNCARFGVR